MKKILYSIVLGSSVIIANSYQDFATHFHLANNHFRDQAYEQALTEYDNALAVNPQCHQAYFNKGLVFAAQQNLVAAQACYEKALELAPEYTKAHMMLGDLYKQQQLYEKAKLCFETIVRQNPDDTQALTQLGKLYADLQMIPQAIHLLAQAAEREPHNTSILLDYANVLTMDNQMDQALEVYHQLLALLPDNPSVLYNIAYTLKKKGAVADSLPYYYRTLELNPENAEAHFGLGLAYLVMGNLTEGWKEYEWRWNRQGYCERNLTQPLWKGEPLAGKTLFIHAEQGLGDTLQFIRYALQAHNDGARVIVAVQDPLVTFLSQCPYLDCVQRLSDPFPPFDYQIPLLSMPYVYQTTLSTIPQTIPYLYADKNLTTQWHNTLAKTEGINIGICWQGNPNYSTAFLRHAVAAKSIPVSHFAPLSNIPGVQLYSLQKISGTEQLNNIPGDFNIHCFNDDFDTEHGRFMDTAAVMKNLDLIITIDTSICHLAGGLGVPVWLMLPNPGDWRWLMDRDDTPWYPGMRLFRQPTPGDWDSVIQTITQELTTIITYYEEDSARTTAINTASILAHEAEKTNNSHAQQALKSYAYSIKNQYYANDSKTDQMAHELERTNQELITCNDILRTYHPLTQDYTRQLQHLAQLVTKREMLKKRLNANHAGAA